MSLAHVWKNDLQCFIWSIKEGRSCHFGQEVQLLPIFKILKALALQCFLNSQSD